MQLAIESLGSLFMKKQKMLELRLKDEMQKSYKSHMFDYSINVTAMRLDM